MSPIPADHIMVFPGEGNLSIPSIGLPQVPSFSISHEIPTVRIPFLSLLLEPRPLRKWLFIWGFCLYLVFCFGCFFAFEQPRLNHDTFIRFGADSPTYWDAVKYRTQHTQTGSVLVSFTGNLLGPVLIGMVFRTGFAVACFNILLFFLAVEVACTIPGVDRYRLLFLLAICSETAPALVTLNKEIMVLVSALLFAKYIYSKRHSIFLLAAVFVVSVFARWEQIAILLLYLFLSRKRSVFRRKPWLAVFAVIGDSHRALSADRQATWLSISERSRNMPGAQTRLPSSTGSKPISAFHSSWCPKLSWTSSANYCGLSLF